MSSSSGRSSGTSRRTSATIWVETDEPCTVDILGAEAPTFSVEGHHYALVIVDGLDPGSVYEYEVALDEHVVWPLPDDPFPPPWSARSTADPLGSCSVAAGRRRPTSLPTRSSSITTIAAAASMRCVRTGCGCCDPAIDEWPDLLVLLGDQVYADDPSPGPATHRRDVRRCRRSRRDPPDEVVADFEQYTWLYHESWTPEVERWVLSVVPSTMIFDDHDMIDDWNISETWVADIRRQPWWQEHIIGGLMSYWIYQHLGNLSPERIREEGMLAALIAGGRRHATCCDGGRPSPSSTRPCPAATTSATTATSVDVRLVVIDSRNGRVLEPEARQMVDDDEWAWIAEHAAEPCRHLLIASSLPVLVPGGLHDLQQWNEAVCATGAGAARGRGSASASGVAIDLEDWSAFDRSFRAMCELIDDTANESPIRPRRSRCCRATSISPTSPRSRCPRRATTCRVRQVVSSPIRNAFVKRERRVIRFAIRRSGRAIAGWLARRAGVAPAPIRWELEHGPIFDNNIGMLCVGDDRPRLVIERARPDENGDPILEIKVDVAL